MKTHLFSPFLVSIIISSGCGGGSSSTENLPQAQDPDDQIVRYEQLEDLKTATNWQELINADPTSLSEDELKEAYWGYALDEYQGALTLATLTQESIYTFWRILEETRKRELIVFPNYPSAFQALGVEAYDLELSDSTAQGETLFDETLECWLFGFRKMPDPSDSDQDVLGHAHFSGMLDDGTGSVTVDFSNCHTDGVDAATGSAFINTYPALWYGHSFVFEGEQYLKSLQFRDKTATQYFTTSGFMSFQSERDDGGLPFSEAWETAFVYQQLAKGTNTLRRLRTHYLRRSELIKLEGALAIGNLGSVSVDYRVHDAPTAAPTTSDYPLHTYTLTGSGGAIANFTFYRYHYLKVELDENGDGIPEWSRFYTDANNYCDSPYTDLHLYPAETVTHPPVIVNQLQWSQPPNTTQGASITFIPGQSYFDPDTPVEDLVVDITWKVEGVVVPEAQNSLSLPDGYPLEIRDFIKVDVTVSDGQNTVKAEYFGDYVTE